MQTKLSKFFGGVIEGSWLVAVITIPIFFNVYSSRIFEPDKASLLRIYVLIGLTAWILKSIDEYINQESKQPAASLKVYLKAQLRKPIILAVFCLGLVYLVSTILSISPSTSLWGSYQRSQGLFTFLAYLILFLLVASNTRSVDQVNRVLSVAILSSFPVSLYGIIQHYGLDPIPWAGNVTSRISANMGNSIFVAAYLVMIVPLTIMRIATLFMDILRKTGNYYVNFSLSVLYILILCMQLTAIFFSGSRGPWIGLAVSLVAVWFGLAFIWRKTSLYIAGLVIFGISIIFLVTINVKGGPLESMRTLPGIGRLGQLLDSESRTGKVRSLIWQGASQLVLPHEPLNYPDGSEDRLNILRPLIGYGPESMFVAFNRFYPPELTGVEKRNAAPDRSHNEIWDSLVFTGLFGTAALLTLFGTIIFYCLRKIGLIIDRQGTRLFILITLAAGVVVTAILVIWKGPGYFGVGLPSGLVLGVVLYMIFAAHRMKPPDPKATTEFKGEWLFLGILAAILAHTVELIFGFGITATRMYFWIFTGVILAMGEVIFAAQKTNSGINGATETNTNLPLSGNNSGGRPFRTRGRNSGSRKNQALGFRSKQESVLGLPWFREGILSAILLALILATLGFDYISIEGASKSFLSNLTIFFSIGSSGVNQSPSIIFMTCWIIIGLVFILEIKKTWKDARGTSLALLIYLLSIFLGLLFFFWLSASLSSIVRNPSSDYEQILIQVKRYENTYLSFVLYSFLIIVGFGWFSVMNWPTKFASLPVKILSPIFIGLVIFPIILMNIRVIQADIIFKAADSYVRAGSWPNAIKLYGRSIELAPREDFYYLYLAKAYFEYAKTLPDETSRNQVLERAEADMLRAQALNPLNTDHTANLARLFSTWSELIDNPEMQTAKAEKASSYYEQALSLSPNNSRLMGEWAFILFSQLDQSEKAYDVLKHALSIDPKYDWLHGILGELYFKLAESLPDGTQERQEYFLQALDAYQNNFNLSPVSDVVSRYRVMLSIARVLSRLGDLSQSIEAYQKALAIYPSTNDRWRILEVLSRLYLQSGDIENALLTARQSLELAPDSYQPQIEALINEIENQP
jgi:tetratricopeptide (TPR) repeat protein